MEEAFGGGSISDYQSFPIFIFTLFLCNDIHDGIALGVSFFLVFNLQLFTFLQNVVPQKNKSYDVYYLSRLPLMYVITLHMRLPLICCHCNVYNYFRNFKKSRAYPHLQKVVLTEKNQNHTNNNILKTNSQTHKDNSSITSISTDQIRQPFFQVKRNESKDGRKERTLLASCGCCSCKH
ncbi:hypothetical protein GGI35DRAFT_169067 [Trichoderma velutinum]